MNWIKNGCLLSLLGTAALTFCHAQAVVDTTSVYNLQNVNSGLMLGMTGASQAAGTVAEQLTADGSANQQWHFVPEGNNEYLIVNANTGQVLGISNGSKTAGALAVQWADNGTADHLWQFISIGSGEYKIKNVNSGLVLGINDDLTTPNQQALQWSDNGTPDHLWRIVNPAASWAGPGLVTGNIVPVADPSMIKANGSYYLFATGGPIQERVSTDRTNFTPSNLIYALPSIPSWAQTYNKTDLWAPDVSFANNTYRMYYAVSKFGTSTSAIGMATTNNPVAGNWTDSGSAVLTSSTCTGANSIDPGLLMDTTGKWWLSFGSFFGGIKMVQINPATGRLLNSTCYSLANRLVGTAIEGAYVYPHGGYYYLFASLDSCCNGTSSTYHVIVGRSTSPNGPFTDRGGIAMTSGGGTIIVATHGNIIGPGGESIFADADGDIFVYHYYDGNNSGNVTLGVNRLAWTSDGWPYLN